MKMGDDVVVVKQVLERHGFYAGWTRCIHWHDALVREAALDDAPSRPLKKGQDRRQAPLISVIGHA